jgi:hypothetical protein
MHPSVSEFDSDSLRVNVIQLFQLLAKNEFEIVRNVILSQFEHDSQSWEEFEIRIQFILILLERKGDENIIGLGRRMIDVAISMDCFEIAMAWRLLLARIIQYVPEDLQLVEFAFQRVKEELVPNGDAKLGVTLAFVLLNALPVDVWINSPEIAAQAVACQDLCISSDGLNVIRKFGEKGVPIDPAISLPFIHEVIYEMTNTDVNKNRLSMIIAQLSLFLKYETVTADQNALRELLERVSEASDDVLDSETKFTLLGAILVQFGTDNELGISCIQHIYEFERESVVFIADRALALCPLLSRNLRAIPVEQVLEIVNPPTSGFEELHSIELVQWETFICRIIWKTSQEIVRKGTEMIRVVISKVADVPDLLLEIIFMEVTLVELSVGIFDPNVILEMLRRLPMIAISNYHRNLAINVLNPLFEQNSQLAAEFGGFIPMLLEGPMNEEAFVAFTQLSGADLFDEANAPWQGEIPPGFKEHEIDYLE